MGEDDCRGAKDIVSGIVVPTDIILVNVLVFLLELTRGDSFVMAWSAFQRRLFLVITGSQF